MFGHNNHNHSRDLPKQDEQVHHIPLLYPKAKRICLSLQTQDLFLNTANSLLLPQLLKRFAGYFHILGACSKALSLWLYCDTVTSHLQITSVFLKLSEVQSERQSEPDSTESGCDCGVMPTLGGDPGGRIHSARALEGELDVCHADSGCHIFINLWSQRKDLTLFCTFLCSCRTMIDSILRVQILLLQSVLLSYHHTFAVEIVARDQRFKCV